MLGDDLPQPHKTNRYHNDANERNEGYKPNAETRSEAYRDDCSGRSADGAPDKHSNLQCSRRRQVGHGNQHGWEEVGDQRNVHEQHGEEGTLSLPTFARTSKCWEKKVEYGTRRE